LAQRATNAEAASFLSPAGEGEAEGHILKPQKLETMVTQRMQLSALPKDDGFPWSSHHTSPAAVLVMCGTHPGLVFWMQEALSSVCRL